MVIIFWKKLKALIERDLNRAWEEPMEFWIAIAFAAFLAVALQLLLA